MSMTSFKYNLTFIVLFAGMTLIHATGEGESKKPIQLYYTAWSVPCRAVMMLIKILDIQFEVHNIDLESHQHHKIDFVKINPQRQVPVIEDNGFFLSESRAILVYLARKFGHGDNESLFPDNGEELPSDEITKVQGKIDEMLNFDMDTLTPALQNLYGKWVVLKTPKTEFKMSKLQDALQKLNTLLHEKIFAVGDSLTVADFSLFANIITIEAFDENIINLYGNINAWYKNCKERILNYQTVNDPAINMIKDRTAKRIIEDENNKVDLFKESIFNRAVFEAVSTLIRAVHVQVISPQHRQYLDPLMNDMKKLIQI